MVILKLRIGNKALKARCKNLVLRHKNYLRYRKNGAYLIGAFEGYGIRFLCLRRGFIKCN